MAAAGVTLDQLTKLLDDRDKKKPALTEANLKKLLDERDKSLVKKVADDVKSRISTHSHRGGGGGGGGILRPPPGGDSDSDEDEVDGEYDDDGEDDAGGGSSGASSDSSTSSDSSSSSSDISGKSRKKKNKKKRSKRKKEGMIRAVATGGWTRNKILSASKKALINVDAEDVYWIPERWSSWLAAPGDHEESRTRLAALRAVHEAQLQGVGQKQMGSLFFETSSNHVHAVCISVYMSSVVRAHACP